MLQAGTCLQVVSQRHCNTSSCKENYTVYENSASSSPRLQRVTCLLQLAMDFFFSTLQDKLQGKLHRSSSFTQNSQPLGYKPGALAIELYIQLKSYCLEGIEYFSDKKSPQLRNDRYIMMQC